MVDTNTYEEKIIRCNNCQEQLANYGQEQIGEQICAICELGFSGSNEIICLEVESDRNGHVHKTCSEQEKRQQRGDSP